MTDKINISVKVSLIDKEKSPKDGRYYYSYTITITNNSNQWVKLISRHWIIIDSEGNKEEVIGDGVIGYYPEFEPNQSFTYTSFCPLETEWGTMEGKYQFIDTENRTFDIPIPRFYLCNKD